MKIGSHTYGFGLPHEASAVFGLILRRDAGVCVLRSKSVQPSSTVTDPVEVDLLKELR